jgi:serine protease Do
VGRQPGDEVPLGVRRNGESLQLRIVLAEPSEQPTGVLSRAWTQLGVRLTPISGRSFRNLSTRYRGGLRVVSVRPEGPASQQGIKAGDVLLGILKWETTSLDDVAYILESDEFRESSSAKFYILRGDETLFGHFRISRR